MKTKLPKSAKLTSSGRTRNRWLEASSARPSTNPVQTSVRLRTTARTTIPKPTTTASHLSSSSAAGPRPSIVRYCRRQNSQRISIQGSPAAV